MNALKKLMHKYKSLPVVVRASMWFVACSMIQKSISFITTPIFTRIMDVEQYGYYNTYLSWLQIVAVFCTLNMQSCIYINGLAKYDSEEKKDKLAVSLLSLSSCLTGILLIIYLIFHTWINQVAGLSTSLFLLMFAEILFQPALNFWAVKQRFEYKYTMMVCVTLLTTVLNAGLGVVFVLSSSETNAAFARVLSIVLVQVLVGGLCWIYFMRRAKKIASIAEWKHALRVQVPLVPHGLSIIVLSSSDRIMINSLIGGTAAGLYSLAYSISFIVKSLKDSVVEAIRPWVYSKIKSGQILEVRKLLKTTVFFVMMLSIFVMALAPEVVLLMGGEKYHEAIYAIPPVIGSTFFMFIYNICIMFEMYYEEVSKITIVSCICAVLNIGLNFWLIPVFGYIAAGYTTLICYIVFCIFHSIIVRHLCKREYDGVQVVELKFLLITSVIVLIVIGAMIFLYRHPILRYIVVGAASIFLVYQGRKLIKISKETKTKISEGLNEK